MASRPQFPETDNISTHRSSVCESRTDLELEPPHSRKRFGAPRFMRVLRRPCVRVSTKSIARLMQADGLQGRPPRRFVITTQRNPADRFAPNLLHRDFNVRATRPLNTVWVSDVTFIPPRMGWLYLAIVVDLASRRVVGWATSAHNDTALVLEALQRALGPCGSRPQAGGIIRTKAALYQ